MLNTAWHSKEKQIHFGLWPWRDPFFKVYSNPLMSLFTKKAHVYLQQWTCAFLSFVAVPASAAILLLFISVVFPTNKV